MKPAVMLQGRSSSDTCSEETDQDDYSTSSEAKRSYDCTFCRRGFTNAQALGGHMNIHRKDKAKGKGSGSVLANKFTHEELSMPSPNFIPQTNIMFESQYHQRSSNYHDHIRFHQPSTTPPSYYYPNMNPSPTFDQYDQFLNPTTTRRYHHHHHQSSSGPNLSLQIGPSHHHVSAAEQVGRGTQRDGADVVVDLELRLGHHPC